jgi:hypothetical protein
MRIDVPDAATGERVALDERERSRTCPSASSPITNHTDVSTRITRASPSGGGVER